MTVYDLIFVLLFLGSVVSLFLSALLRGKPGSRNILAGLASVWVVYFGILLVTDVLSSQKVFKIGEEQCFDEMCFAVVGVQAMPNQGFHASAAAPSMLYVVKIRVASHSRGRAQAEGGLRGRLYDNDKYIDVSEPAQKAYDSQYGGSPKLTQKIGPGESIVCNLVFDVPQGLMQHSALTLDHGFTPGYFVIGESPFFHKPDIHQLPSVQ